MPSYKKFRKIFKDILLVLIVINTTYCCVSVKAGIAVQKKDSVYLWLLQECNEEVFTKTFEYPFLTLLNKDLEKEYKSLDSLTQKKAYIEYYWKEHDPNPLMNENEYLLNFIERSRYVQQHFSCPDSPYFDDRGKYYLRYGEPTTRFTQAPKRKYTDLFKDKKVLDLINGILFPHGVRRISPYFSLRGNETWVYQFLTGDRESEAVLHFVDEGRCFREVKSLDKAIIHPRSIKYRYFYWADLLKERAAKAQSQSIFRTCEEIWDFENEIDIVAYGGQEISSLNDVYHPVQKLLNIDTKLRIDLENKKSDAPKTVFTADKAVQEILFHYDITQFKGSQEATILAVNYFTPLSDNFTPDTRQVQSDSVQLHYGCLFENQKLQQVVRTGYEKSYSLEKLSRIELPYVIGNMSISLLPKKGRITLQVKDEETQRRGFIKQDMQLRDFSTPELCLSDIQFCQQVGDSLNREVAPVRHLRGISVIPYPYEKIAREQQIFCYFEIYNIMTGGIEFQYEISLEVTIKSEKQGVLKKAAGIFSRSADNSISIHHTRGVEQNDSRELIGIDFSNLKKGYYILSIRVNDKDDPDISAEVKRNIKIEG